MVIKRITRIIYLFLILLLTVSFSFSTLAENEDSEDIPKAEREFRAAWIATVANINWPSKPGLPVDEQKKEAINLLDLLYDNNFNAAVFQVRPQCDALYKSELEPWSYYLTGQQGQAPDPYYDPLEFWIEEAHKRGIELHVWLNPYRAHHVSGGEVTEHSVVKRHPNLVLELSSGYWWLDPSRQETRNHSHAVVMDIVKRYDIDGVHFDDYFYPYPSYHDSDFPDDESWSEYKSSGGDLSRGDWRRESVNVFVEELYDDIKDEKPFVKFGLSPFGIWRPDNPPSIKGFDQYEQLYADAKLWLNEGWIDYWTPQLYWTINRIPQSYPVLLGWWNNENEHDRHFWPGISVGRGSNAKGIDENINQIMITRGMLSESPGVVHWSIAGVQNKDYAAALKKGPYKEQALVPASPWLDDEAPDKPEISTNINESQLEVKWNHVNSDDVFRTVVYFKHDETWNYSIMNVLDESFTLQLYEVDYSSLRRRAIEDVSDVNELLSPLTHIAVSAVDRVGNESELAIVAVTDIREQAKPTLEEISREYNLRKKVDWAEINYQPVIDEGDDIENTYYLLRLDDMGMCHTLNMAIQKVIDAGIPFSTSVMFACPWYQEAVEILKENPDVGVGIHLTLNAEWKNYRWGPVLGAEAVPSLVDSNGYFFPSRSKLFANNPQMDEIESELRAQIERAINSGIRIDYLDYHMGAAVQTTELRKLVESLAEEYGLGMSGYFSEKYSSITYAAPLGEKTDSLVAHVKKFEPGVNMQVVHVGIQTPEMNALEDMNEFGLKEMSRHREEEMNALLNPQLPGILKGRNVKVITYKELIEKVGLENMYRPEDSEY